jgi:hypothetical protein
MRLVIGIVIAGAALMPAAAHGHDGGLWFQTAANTSRNIPDKYPTVASARCQPLAAAQRVLYHAHSMLQDSVRYWDHFECMLNLRSGSVCQSVAHITGQHWNNFYLTSFPTKGCTPYQLRP